MDTYADDLAELTEKLGLHDPVLVGHSTGGGKVAAASAAAAAGRRQGGAAGRGSAADAEDRRQSARHADGSL
jgi:pimeloyl-ACP methyl ester carboxylesterase